MRGHNNVQGAADMGSMPDELPGYQAVDDPEVRARFEKGWNVPSTAEGAEDRTGGIILRGCLVVARGADRCGPVDLLERSLSCPSR
jgi:anaerobic selenocysteine-containing dehydrogenase